MNKHIYREKSGYNLFCSFLFTASTKTKTDLRQYLSISIDLNRDGYFVTGHLYIQTEFQFGLPWALLCS